LAGSNISKSVILPEKGHLKSTLKDHYGNRLRVRVCGILVEKDQILLVRHAGIGEQGYFWCAPGGGLEFGETLNQCLQREFREETGLEIEVQEFYSHYEFLQLPLHAIELFYKVKRTGGELKTGTDPETPDLKVIDAVEWISIRQLSKFPVNTMHPIVIELAVNPD
jgi:8-oxo-dGTP diphosphatase